MGRAGSKPGGRRRQTRAALALSWLFVMSGHPCSLLAAGNDGVETQLARARAQLTQMQIKLDNWLLNAARREDEVQHQLARRDARIAELSVLLSDRRERQGAGAAQAGWSQDLEALQAELSNLRQEAKTKEAESEKLRSYVQRLEDGIRQRDDAIDAARDVVRVSKRELDDRASRIEGLRQELETARAALANSDGASLKTRHAVVHGASIVDPQGIDMGRGLYAETRTPRRSAPPDALRQARAGAHGAALAYLRLRDQKFPPEGHTRPERPEVQQAFREMFSHQARVANLIGARGLYQVREKDTLSLVAGHATGDQANWPALFTANAHLMSSPDQLIAGLVLIIPSP